MDQWLAVGPTDPADRLKDEAMAKVVVTPQVRGSLFHGRFTTMTAITGIAAALVLALSGAGPFLTASDTEPVERPPAATQAELADIVAQVSGRLGIRTDPDQRAEIVFDSGRMRVRGAYLEGVLLADDARLGGEASWTFNSDFLRPNLGSIYTTGMVIENEAGSWEGILEGWGKPSADLPQTMSGVVSGDGAYDGLSAYLQFSLADDEFDVDGYIFPGEMPEAP